MRKLQKSEDYWYVFGKLKSLLPENEYVKFISGRLSDRNRKVPENYKCLWELGIGGVITFNIDKLVLNAYSEVKKSAVDFATGKEIVKYKHFASGDDKFVFFPHGEISDSESWVFINKEKKVLYQNNDFQKAMTALSNSRKLLIIGFNPREYSFIELLNNISMDGSISGYDNYYICPDLKEQDYMYLAEYGITCIPYHPEAGDHPEIKEALTALKNSSEYNTYTRTDWQSAEVLPDVLISAAHCMVYQSWQ